LAYGQYSSNLQGVVTDPSGAVVPNATVQLTSTATQVSSKQTTDSGGNYLFNSTAPGDYEVLVSANGFNPTRVIVTLRGLSSGRFRVTDYVQNREVGEVTAAEATLSVSFRDSLLLLAEPVSASRM